MRAGQLPDRQLTAEMLDLFGQLNESGRTIVVITHEEEVAHHARRVVRMRDGLILSDERLVAVGA